MKQSKLIKRFRVDRPKSFKLVEFDPAETAGFKKAEAQTIVKAHAKRLGELQERLYAEDRWALLIILQGVDAAGKDGVIKRVMADLNPQGCTVHPFKVPTSEELEHDFLWRVVKRLPCRGDIAIFNRSHYEDVLVVRVHEGPARKAQASARARHRPHLAGAVRRHQRVRAASHAQRHRGGQVPPAYLQGGAETPIAFAAGRAGQALEVLR